jgi:hypothetical protein
MKPNIPLTLVYIIAFVVFCLSIRFIYVMLYCFLSLNRIDFIIGCSIPVLSLIGMFIFNKIKQ